MRKMFPLPVFLKKDGKSQAAPARFEESIVRALWNAENSITRSPNEVDVDVEISQDSIILMKPNTLSTVPSFHKIPLRSPPFCPIESLEQNDKDKIPKEIKSRGVALGVAILLESSDKTVLLTRRSGSMRTFPHIWVPPGGHVEQGEKVFQAACREVLEEIGLNIMPSDTMSILGLWESSYPVKLHLGLPKRHHIVMYFHQKLSKTASALNKEIVLDKSEVDACTWIDSCVASRIISTDGQFSQTENEFTVVQKPCISETHNCAKGSDFIEGVKIDHCGRQVYGKVISIEPLFADVDEDIENERVSTGTKYALKLWLDKFYAK